MKNKSQQKKLLMKSPFREMLLLAFFLMITIAGFAQSKTVTGIVIDKTGETVIGASVLIKGTTTGVITNLDGSFTLQDVPTNGIIQVSFVGYKTVSIPVKGQSAIKVVLEEDNETLDEVVVVGYGVQKKSDLTGSVMQVKPKILLR